MSEKALTTLLTEAASEAPQRAWTVDDIRTASRRRRVRRRTWATAGAVGVAATVAAVAVGVSAPPSSPATPTLPPASSGLAVGFPIAAAIAAVSSALPAGAVVGELPPDIAWRDGGGLTVPLVVDGAPTTLDLVAADAGCTATSDALSRVELDAVSAAVCAARLQALDANPTGLPSGGGPAS
jgi:hypothetical protein